MVIAPASTPAAPQGENDEAAGAEMAARIASGPGFWTDWLADLDRQGLLEDLLAAAGRGSPVRQRVLPGQETAR